MNLECPRCGKSPWNWAGETEDYCRCDEEYGGFVEQPANYVQQPLKDKNMALSLNLKQFEEIRNGEVFATGILPNSASGLFMTNNGGELRWVAKKGWGNDWAIYCHWSYMDIEWIKNHGEKVSSEINIKKCIDADPEILKLYRY